MDFSQIKESMEQADKEREIVIKDSRNVLKASKQAIFALHRDNLDEAKDLLKTAKEEKEAIEKKIRNPRAHSGSFSNACEEYAEAALFLHFQENAELLPFSDIAVTEEEYLGACADLTGELGRRAVILATDRKQEEVKKIRDFSDDLYGEFDKFDFRNGELRGKYDSIKYNLQKMEQVLYNLEMNK